MDELSHGPNEDPLTVARPRHLQPRDAQQGLASLQAAPDEKKHTKYRVRHIEWAAHTHQSYTAYGLLMRPITNGVNGGLMGWAVGLDKMMFILIYVRAREEATIMAMVYYMVMSLIGFDMHNHELLFDTDLSKDSENTDLLPEAPGEAKARFGSATVRKLANRDVYGGLFWRYSLLVPRDFVPVDDVTHMLT
ncbi:hypothetical protein VPNG_06851 [Cytospora leucostoma]|uniref:Uncharacterized protein n=1 Tax=Cytospora leucostoma TaxID=1230097 RepID=A0A423WVW5_9PEZI|nr:hypothetical protein VPNG_06851 [Cytospora leucostoma]